LSVDLLYSTNPLIKLLLQERFFGDVHYVWCSESHDSGSADPYSIASHIPPSSNPRDIYRDLGRAVERGDKHNATIVRVRAMYAALSEQSVAAGTMGSDERDELLYIANGSDLTLWRPVLYVIPRDSVAGRLEVVPAERRAGAGQEFIIRDLARDEFDRIEF
jgi:hypothetical protein